MTAAARGLIVAAALIGLAVPAAAHSPSRHLIGIHSPDRGTRPSETWGTYCVTELAPLFREAVAMNIAKGLSPAGWPLQLTQAATGGAAPSSAGTGAPAEDIGVGRTPPGGAPDAVFPQIEPPAGKITVFVARKFVTMDPGWPEATAVAVADGKIVSVGVTLDDLKPWLDKYPYEIDDRFKDKVIYPGFVEAHTHPVMGSLAISRPSLSHFPLRNPYGADIPGTKNRADAIAKLRQYVAAAKPGETVLTWGYDILAMGAGFDRKQLDAITTAQPLLVWDASEHNVYTNGAAIAQYGVTKQQLADTVGAGRYADGSSDGRFLGTDAARLILPQVIAEQMQPEAAKTNLRYLGALMQQAGVTTLGDLFFGGVNLELETLLSKTFYDTPSSIARIVHVPDGFTFQKLFGDKAVEKAKELEASSSDLAIYRGVKFYADDAYLSLGMEMQWPGYVDADKYKGLFMYSSEAEFTDAMRPWWNAGFQIHVHSNGSGGNEITLDALANLQAEKPRFDHRFTFEHFGISSVAQGRRVKALGAQVSTNPYYVYERADLTAPQIGTDRASLASRMKSLVDQDIVLSLHSDTPVGVPSPLLEVWVAVNRIGYGTDKVHAPHERMDVARAMKMVTIDAAATLGVEDKVGTIETGKFADFTVLDADPQEVEPMKIRDIGVVATILGGRITMTADTRTP